MMKKMTVLLTALVMLLAMAVPTAFAATTQIPDLANCFPDDITFVQEDAASGIRVYAADDVEVLMNDVAEYMGILCADYGFGGIETDFESSNSFVYVYLTEFSGDATPEYIDSCPEEAYVLVAMTGTGDQYIAMVVTVEGIEFSDSGMASTVSGMDAYDFAALPDPGLFIGAERHEDYENRTNDTPMVSYNFEMTEDGENAAFSYMEFIMEEYGYELVHTYEEDFIDVSAQVFTDFYFEYTGSHYVSIIPYEEYIDDPDFDGSWNVKVSFVYDFAEGTILMSVYYAPEISLVDSGEHTSYEVVDMKGSSGGGGSLDWDDDGGHTEERCIICDGTGWRDCLTCNGSGYTGYGSDRHECPSFNCRGGDVSCTTCGGDGRK